MTDEPSWLLLLIALAISLALVAVILRLSITDTTAVRARFGTPDAEDTSSGRTRPAHSDFGGEAPPTRRAAVVVNPSKFDDVAKVRDRLTQICLDRGWAEPLWLETTIEDPGLGQARQAIEAGVDLVCALGGDGTVRTVASALVGTGMPMGLLPAGTGNLLARNFAIPVDSLSEALTVALTGRNARIDTCTLTLTRATEAEEWAAAQAVDGEGDDDGDDGQPVDEPASGGRTEEHLFLVMAGLGFDAEMMAGVEEKLKARVGWAAYVVSGARHLRGPQFRVEVRSDEGLRLRRRVRNVVVGNVGKLQGGMVLFPDAKADDGMLDVLLLSPEGVVGWGAVGARLITRQRKGHHRVDHHTCRTLHVRSNKPVAIQLDGDSMGKATAMTVAVNPLSLVLRRPA